MASILLTGGGSAGHVMPHLALLPYLKNYFDKIYYVGSESGMERQIIKKANLAYYSISTAKLVRKFTLKNFCIPFKVIKGIIQAEKILDKLKPDVIFSKGGYVSLPVVFAGYKRKIPVIIHESDYTVGLTNKLCAKKAKTVLTTFPETAKIFSNGKFMGAPIRKINKKYEKEDLRKFFKFKNDKPVLLVTGGSQGAKAINDAVRLGIFDLVKNFNVIHLCGKGNLDKRLSVDGYYQAEFLDEIDKAFFLCDLCVSRAGSNTIFELLSQEIPTLLIPLPKDVSRGDQILNADYFEKLGLVRVLSQEKLTSNSLLIEINLLYKNKERLKTKLKTHGFFDQSENIAKFIADSLR